MDKLMQFYDALLNAYGQRHWWPAQSPYEMMVGAILTQNTTWGNVEKAINNFGPNLTPEFIASVSPEELAPIIRPSGYYNQKAIKLKALTDWYAKYSYDTNEAMKMGGQLLRTELLAVHGVGYETADSILLYALDKPFFVVDAYTKRILYRLKYDIPGTYDELRLKIEANIPCDTYVYGEFHALIVEHAKQHCRKHPSCEGCPVEAMCSKRIA